MRGRGGYQAYEMWGHTGAGRGGGIRGILKKPGLEGDGQQWWVCLGLTGLGITVIAVIMVAILGFIMAVILLRG